MFNTKLEVDRHVESCLKKINNESERNLRCFAFARLYFKVGEYEQARRYVSTYLTTKPLSAEALSFLGKALEKLGKLEAAVDAFRRSLEIDPKQNSLLMKICELLSTENVSMDIANIRYFCEKAQRVDPYSPVVFNLKERLVAAESQDPNDVAKLLLTELETRSTDVHLRVRLLRHLLQNNQIKEAYKHASDIELKSIPIFLNSLSWYEIVAEVLVRYEREHSSSDDLTWEFWLLFVSVLDKLASLILNDHFSNIKSSSECSSVVFNLDQTLAVAAKHVINSNERSLVQEFLNHSRAQLCLHFSTLLFKQAKSDLLKFKDALNLSLPLLFVAYHTQPPELNSMWLDHSSEIRRLQMQKWHKEAAFRCSQAGHILQAAAKDRRITLIEKAVHSSSGLWREQLFKKLFITRDEHLKMITSYFVTCPQLTDITFQLPDVADLTKYDEQAQLMYPDLLHNLIWICLNKKLSTFKCTIFDGLQYSVKTLNNCSAESLNALDIESFIYCATLTTQAQLEELKNQAYYNTEKLSVLPASITDQLGTLKQSNWLKAVYKMYKNDVGVNLSEVRLNLITGIETVRCVGNHGLDVKVLVTLANTFTERAKHLTKQSEIEFNEARADLYWKAALPLLEKLHKHQVVAYAPNRLFECKSKEMSQSEILTYIEEARLFNGVQLLKRKEYEKALHVFDSLKSPYASYNQAQIYKIMAEEQLNQNKENVTSEMRSQHIILLSRSRDCFYLTLDRLRDPLIDRKHPLNKQLGSDIEKIERLLSRIDSDIYNHRNDCDALSDENVSSVGSMGDHFNNFHSSTHYPAESFTPQLERTRYRLDLPMRREARPSPERLDAQLRQMQASRDVTVNHIMEQNRVVVDSHRTLMEEFRWLKEAVGNITSSVNDFKNAKYSANEELQGIKDSISGLKSAVEELQSFRDITDLVQEMKKEIAELKKDQGKSKNNQLSEEDLYVLDDEYSGDYGMNSNVTGFNPGNLYPNYQGRLAPTYPPAALYPGMYPVYPYPNLGLPQAGTLPFGQETQITDFRTLNLPQSLTQPGYVQPNLQQTKPAWDVGVQPNLGQLNLVQPIIVPQLQPQSQQPNLFRDSITTTATSTTPAATSSNIFSLVSSSIASISKAPINVVITSSDPLPTTSVTTTQILSVTIPPQHLKGGNLTKSQPHNYQIPLPSASVAILNTTPTIISQPPPVVTTQGLLSNVAPPIYSAIDSKNTGLGLKIEKSLNQSFNKSNDSKGNLSSTSVDEHDPCPDFKPIIPLPDEVPVNTGEENEIVLFSERAKLFRFTNKEWRERGVGNIKILENKDTGKIRLVMRRDQVHKICANHFITKDMVLKAGPNSNRAFVWAANDFADQEMVLEKLCVRFKTEDEAHAFFVAFENVRTKLSVEAKAFESATSLGGFTFTSTPTFKPKDDVVTPKVTVTTEIVKTSPFASFTFGAKTPTTTKYAPPATNSPEPSSTLENDKDFESTAEFQPVVPLPDLVEVRTGEENAEILFESHAKLLRYDTPAKEWKECGVGIMKLLKEHIIRLVMRRDQVLKVCCNHQLLKNMKLSKMPKNSKALSWCAQDYSDGVVRVEMFSIRFKSEEQADAFYKAVTSAQELLDENNVVKSDKKVIIMEIKDDSEVKASKGNEDKKAKAEAADKVEPAKASGWGDKFKPKAGTWKCKNCYIPNEGKDHLCVACETPKNNTTPKKLSEAVFSFGVLSPPVVTTTSTPINFSKSQFSFGTPVITTVASSTSFVFGQKPISWGDSFKPKEGSWECPTCCVRNDAEVLTCISCQYTKKESAPAKPISSWDDKFKPKTGSWECPTCCVRNDAEVLTCISCQYTKPAAKPISAWGDKFKPKAGSWECHECLVRNDADKLYCVSCDSPKDETVPKKDDKPKGISLETPGLQFTFGMPATATTTSSATFNFITQPSESQADSTSATKPFSFKTGEDETKDRFVFGSPQQHAFEFTPRSPRQHSSCGQGDEESDSFVEDEGDHIHFKPVIPLPNKIDVKTGEEQEKVLYCHRAKLFRFVDSEWKERGIGDVKILLKPDTEKLRVLMRRDQVLKICLNHVLTSEIEYLPKDDKTWLFSAPDYSEGEINHWQFCIRFKSPDVAQDFKKAIDDALNNSSPSTIDVSRSDTQEDDSDVEFISETQVTPEEEQEAIRLKLPPKFMSYRQLRDCSCELCKKENDTLLYQILKDTTTNKSQSAPSATTEKFVFNKPITFGVPPATTSQTLKDILAKPKLLTSIATSPKTETSTFKSFSFSIKTDTQTTPTTTPATNTFSQTPQKSVFGGITFVSPPTSGGNIFANANKTSSGNIFGADIFGPTNLFTVKENKPLVGNTPPPTFNPPIDLSQTAKGEPKKDDEPILKCDSNLSFASLSSAANAISFEKKAEDGDKVFSFLGSGAPVFASQAKTQKKKDKNKTHSGDEGDASEPETGEEYDPHYEPIVALPDAIIVSTGEEDEISTFNERAKLYRYDNNTKEWKERGVGQMKILHHPVNGTYRFILRREQVHKVVLNMLITSSLELQPMHMSDKAWLWCGINHSEEGAQVEKLAARFKSCELSNSFFQAVQVVVSAVKELQDRNLPSMIQNFGLDVSDEHSESREEGEEDEDDEDDNDDDEDEDERTIMFMKPCHLSEETVGQWNEIGTGDLAIFFEPEVYGSHIVMCDSSGVEIMNTTIGTNAEMTIEDNDCVWKAIEWNDVNPRWRTLKATFSSTHDAEEFHCRYLELVQYAHETGIVDPLDSYNQDTDEE